MPFIVAIDGPAGTGKGTITKLISKELGLVNIDTGAMYRCVTLQALRQGITNIEEKEKIIQIARNIDIKMKNEGEEQQVYLNEENVSKEIRSKEVSAFVSPVSSIPEVREIMVDLQRRMAQNTDVIMEGRDITTVVFPNADVKIYLDASVEERAKRRFKENQEKGLDMTYEEVLEAIKIRDYNDMNKPVGALKIAEDAIVIDTTSLTIGQVEEKVRKIILSKREEIKMAILLPGGAGYIGSHTAVELLNKGKEVIILDNFSNSKPEVLDKIKQITGKDFKFYELDYLNKQGLEKVFRENNIEAVINFAGFKAVGESVKKPIEYYTNNICGALNLLDVMKKYDCKKFIFSSSATVYGDPEIIPITEECKVGGTTNPYGTTKLFIEQILEDVYKSDNSWDICILRYFNPVGSHESGLIGEEPNGIPNNLMPYIVRVASGQLEQLSVFGNDYNTPDGTGVRDYIHVVDLAKGHVNALEKLEKEQKGLYIYNLGTGTGYSVLDVVKAFEKATGKTVKYRITGRREGDIATCYADPTKAKHELGWQAEKNIEDMCRDSWNYIEKNK